MRKRIRTPDDGDGSAGPGGRAGVDDRQFVVALHRGLEVLRCFEKGSPVLGNQELAQRTRLPKATVSRLTYTLSSLGYLDYLEEISKYRIGIPVLNLGFACLAGVGVQETARPMMRRLAEFAGRGAVVAMAGRDDVKMIFIAVERAGGLVSLQLDVGSRVSLSRSGIGRGYLAGLPETERLVVMQRIRDHVGEANWPRIEDGILRSIDEVRTQGFCLNVGEWQEGVTSVGAPFRPPYGDGRLLALNCGGASFQLPRDVMKNEVGPKLVEMIRELESSKGQPQ